MKLLSILRDSLFARLSLIFIAAALLNVAVLSVAFKNLFRNDMEELSQNLVRDYATRLLIDLGSPPQIARAESLSSRLKIQFAYYNPETTQSWSTHELKPQEMNLRFHPRRSLNGWEVSYTRRRGQRFVRLRRGNEKLYAFTPSLGSPMTPALFIGTFISSTLLCFGFAYFWVRRLFRPLQSIAAGAQQIGKGDLEHVIPDDGIGDLSHLSQQVNRMASSLSNMLQSKQQLLLAVSHELRSPLTRLKLALELSDSKDLKEVRVEVNELEHLVSRLLESESLSSPATSLERSSVNPRTLIEEWLDRKQMSPQEVSFAFNGQEVSFSMDPVRFELAVSNLVSNALRYGIEKPIRLELNQQEEQLLVKVTNRGPEIPEEEIAKLGQPFYRPDPSRTKSSGGLGLGLYLVRRIAESHRGTFSIVSKNGQTEVGFSFKSEGP